MTAAVNTTGIGLQIYLDLRIIRTLKSSLALVFAETNLFNGCFGFPSTQGLSSVREAEILLVTFPGIFKPSILNADVIHFTLVATTSCTFSERVKLSTCKLDSNFESKAQPLKRLFLDFLFKNFLLPTRLLPFFLQLSQSLNFQTEAQLFSSTSTHFHPRSQNFSHN